MKNDIFGLKWGQDFENRAGYPGGGDPHMKGVGMFVGNFELNQGDRYGRGPSSF